MIYASDLDRTLIYSKRFVKKHLENDLVSVEYYKGQVISYITEKSLELLKEISSKCMFIPITTRTTEQYLRINIFDNDISNKYAVTTNGGSILIDGKLDDEWENIIKEQLKDCEDIYKVIDTYKNMVNGECIIKSRIADNKFFYDIIDTEKFDHSSLDEFNEYLKANGWSKYNQGRKIYYIPNILTKRNALMHIMKRENIKDTIVSGDSLLDLSMLEIASEGFVPLHGDVIGFLSDNLKKHIHITTDDGFKATEEFLYEIQNGLY